ncbi:MAG: AMP-binding protein [Alphaproteobacteria bacterium]|nr:AMP-binding protein [Alphaproteobacteria bacterium]
MTANIALSFDAAAAAHSDKTILVGPQRSYTWRELDLKAGAVAAGLQSDGIAPGQRLAICFEDPLDTIIGVFGGLKAGCVITPFNARLKAEERDQVLSLLDPTMVLDSIPDGDEEFPAQIVNSEDPAIILFTSGSTGVPKGAVLSHRSVTVGLDMWCESSLAIEKNDIVLSVLPLAHSYGLFGTVMAPLMVGAQSVVLPRFGVEDVLSAIKKHKATIFCGVATMFRRLLDSGEVDRKALSSLRFATSGAAPCPWELAEDWRVATDVRIVRGYGMSELFRPVCYSPVDSAETPQSIGHAAKGVSLKIVDEDGNSLEGEQTGELWIKSDSCMTEYLDRPEDTAAVMEDGWFKTGDLATISLEGLVSIVGRKKEVILRGGYTVAAGEVETVLNAHPDVSEAAVISVPDRDLGEEICAFVVLKSEAHCSEQEIIDFCKSQMAAYKYPRIVSFVPDLPKGATGKVDKAKLKA